MAFRALPQADHEKIEAHIKQQTRAIGPNSPALMKLLDEIAIEREEHPKGLAALLPKPVTDIIMDAAECLGKDPIFYVFSFLCMKSTVFKDIVVQMNGTERNPLTLFM